MKLKYVDTEVTFSEVPDEISLCINLSNCPHKCEGCHSPYLQSDIGELLTPQVLEEMIDKNGGITCVCLMGGDNDLIGLCKLADVIRWNLLKAAWYTGLDFHLDSMGETVAHPLTTQAFDYIKTGSYNKHLGPLTSKKTNQRMYKKVSEAPIKFEDITYKFWK